MGRRLPWPSHRNPHFVWSAHLPALRCSARVHASIDAVSGLTIHRQHLRYSPFAGDRRVDARRISWQGSPQWHEWLEMRRRADVTPPKSPKESAPETTRSSPHAPEPAPGYRNAVIGGLLKIISQEESVAQKADAERLGKISRRLLKRLSFEDLRDVLAQGADPSVADECVQTALMLAAFPPFAEVQFEILAEAGANLEARRNDGFTGLHLACLGGSDEIALAWMRAGANIHARTAHGSTPLMLACGSNRTLHQLLRAGANPNDVDIDGHTALCCAVIAQRAIDPENQLESIRALIAAGTYLNIRDRNGKTALGHAYYALHKAQVEVDVHRAFARGLDLTPPDEIQLATSIIKMLEDAGAEV